MSTVRLPAICYDMIRVGFPAVAPRCDNFFRLDTACACTARLVHGGESRNQDWNYSDQQERRSASKAKLARHTTASSTLKETLMHARVPIAPEKTRPSPTPLSPPGDPHDTARRSPQRPVKPAGCAPVWYENQNLNCGQDTRANRTRHTASSSTQPHANQQLTNAPQTNLTFTRTHTHLPNGDRCQRTPPRITATLTQRTPRASALASGTIAAPLGLG